MERAKKEGVRTTTALSTPTKGRIRTVMADSPIRGRSSSHCLLCSRALRLRLVVSREAEPTFARRSDCQCGWASHVIAPRFISAIEGSSRQKRRSHHDTRSERVKKPSASPAQPVSRDAAQKSAAWPPRELEHSAGVLALPGDDWSPGSPAK
jgi:hypothetical protein